MIGTFEEISRNVYADKSIVIQRKLDCKSKFLGLQGIPQEELEEERRENNGLTIWELRMTLIQHIAQIKINRPNIFDYIPEIPARFNSMQVIFNLIGDCRNIKPQTLCRLYKNIDEMLLICENISSSDLPEFVGLLKKTHKKITSFYLSHPYRTLELSDTLSEKILTVEACLTPPFLPYIKGKMEPPKWMVPTTVNTMNEACKIHQTRKFIKKEGMDLFVLLSLSPKLPSTLWKIVAHYAVDVEKIKFRLFDVVTDQMLIQAKFSHLIHCRQMDLGWGRPIFIITV
uniref:Uncharacterized protein n=1 Tax=viral metagenome TaxID=1070528 RepID=A0A6C0HSM7_9ZZZZ